MTPAECCRPLAGRCRVFQDVVTKFAPVIAHPPTGWTWQALPANKEPSKSPAEGRGIKPDDLRGLRRGGATMLREFVEGVEANDQLPVRAVFWPCNHPVLHPARP